MSLISAGYTIRLGFEVKAIATARKGHTMYTYYATCHTPDNLDLDRLIQGLGGPVMGWLNIDVIIRMIDEGHTFFTQPPFGAGQKIITAIHPRSRRRYLKTVADGVEPNNILALPRCPQR